MANKQKILGNMALDVFKSILDRDYEEAFYYAKKLHDALEEETTEEI